MSAMDPKSIRLTETVKKGGCAAKLPAGHLRQILKMLQMKKPRELSVGTETMDDACVWDLNHLPAGQSLVQTLDFFTPMVDDAYDFGAIAAANALSDVYAMGGTPKIALSILAFPSQTLPLELLEPLLQGAIDKIEEAGACLAGGHSIDDDTLKFGLSVTGFVASDRSWKNSGARPGDVLILTKALGTGTLTSAIKAHDLDSSHLLPLLESMKQLNRVPELLQTMTINGATDITGFGLAGHTMQMMRASGVSVELEMAELPLLPGTVTSLKNDNINRAHASNWSYIKDEVEFSNLSQIELHILTDPQTSGGLLLSVPETEASEILGKLKDRFPMSVVIGRVTTKDKFDKLRIS